MSEDRTSLWLVEIDGRDWDRDRFAAAAVWAESPERAEQLIRTARHPRGEEHGGQSGQPWVEPEWRLTVTPAPTEGVVLTHWHVG